VTHFVANQKEVLVIDFLRSEEAMKTFTDAIIYSSCVNHA